MNEDIAKSKDGEAADDAQDRSASLRHTAKWEFKRALRAFPWTTLRPVKRVGKIDNAPLSSPRGIVLIVKWLR
jgi:hypothetical protein